MLANRLHLARRKRAGAGEISPASGEAELSPPGISSATAGVAAMGAVSVTGAGGLSGMGGGESSFDSSCEEPVGGFPPIKSRLFKP
jgi:hypothetical protein